jgi:hypothetical protein
MDRFGRAAAASVVFVLAIGAAPKDAAAAAPGASAIDHGAEVVLRALSLLGVNYRWGGNTPETGLDCSGLVRLVFSEAVGLPLPRRSEEISRVGNSVHPTELQPGDLVFFNTLRRAFSHVGIYIGNNQFVHAPATGGQIRVETLDKVYWTKRFNGARRLLSPELAAASVVPRASRAATPFPAQPPRPVAAGVRASTRSGSPGGPRPASGVRGVSNSSAPLVAINELTVN